jgi:hypothetical protein
MSGGHVSTRQGVLDGLAAYAGLRGTEHAEAMRRQLTLATSDRP